MRLYTSLLIIFLLASTLVQAQEASVEKLFYQAVYAEQIDGDLDKARSLYEQILKAKPDDRQIIGKTLYRLGLISEKDGTRQALSYYAKVVEEFSEQKDLIELVQARVDKLEDVNTFIDPRDGHKYKYVKIGDQTWMAENLAYMPWVNPPKKQEYGIWIYDYEGDDVGEAKATENYQKYGCLYDWATAMALGPDYLEKQWDGDPENNQGLCPPGWRMPSDKDWMEVEHSLGMPDSVLELMWDRAGESYGLPPVGKYFRSSISWVSGGNGTNSSGFNALPSGWLNTEINQSFNKLGYETYYWTSTSDNYISGNNYPNFTSIYRQFVGYQTTRFSDQDDVNRDYSTRKSGNSVRCIKSSVNTKIEDQSIVFVAKATHQVIESTELDLSSGRIIKPTELWHHTSGVVWPSIIVGDTLFFVANNQKIIATNKVTGEVLWTTELEGRLFFWGQYDHNKIYLIISGTDSTNFLPGIVQAYGLKNGEKQWEIDVFGPFHKMLLNNNHLVIDGQKLLEINIATGRIDWEYFEEDNTRFREFQLDGDRIYTGKQQWSEDVGHGIIAIDKGTKKTIWQYNSNSRPSSNIQLSDSKILCGLYNGYFMSFDSDTGETNWKIYLGLSDFVSHTNRKFTIIHGSSSRNRVPKLICISNATGQIIWSKTVPFHASGFESTTINGKILLCSPRNNQIIGINIFDGKVNLTINLDSFPYSFIIENEKLYASTKDGLYCYDISKLIE